MRKYFRPKVLINAPSVALAAQQAAASEMRKPVQSVRRDNNYSRKAKAERNVILLSSAGGVVQVPYERVQGVSGDVCFRRRARKCLKRGNENVCTNVRLQFNLPTVLPTITRNTPVF